MLLAIDVGNTNITVAAYEGARLAADWRVRTDRERTTDEHGLLLTHLLQHRGIETGAVAGIAISSVVPTMTDSVTNAARRYFDVEPFVVGPGTDFGFAIHYRPPSDVGADRLVNAVAVRARYGCPAIVVDLGTGTTFDVIDGSGDYLGGAISPGIGIASDALFQAGSRLFRVELSAPPHAVGQTTVEALQSGIVFGFAGLVDALVRRIKREVGENAKVIATGGLAGLIRDQSETIEVVDPLITMEGLRILWERNGLH
jgi:type III pantothenate kinase